MTFRPGQSGNPAGRPRGIPDRRMDLKRRLESAAPDLLDQAIQQARSGDPHMMRLLLSRVLPAPKAESAAVLELPGDSLSDHASAILKAATSGELSPSAATELLAGLSAVVKIREAEEVIERVRRLEERLG